MARKFTISDTGRLKGTQRCHRIGRKAADGRAAIKAAVKGYKSWIGSY